MRIKKILAAALLVCMIASCALASAGEFSLPLTGETVTIRIFDGGGKMPDETTKMGQFFKEQFGNLVIEAETAPNGSAFDEKARLYLASGDLPDIISHNGIKAPWLIQMYADSGLLLNLLDYSEYMPYYTERRTRYPHLSMYDVDGASYVFQQTLYDMVSETWVVNQDLLDKYGLAIPNGYDEMVAALEIVIPNEPDIMGVWLAPWGSSYVYNNFATLFGGSEISPSDFYYDFDSSEWKFALTSRSEIYKNATQGMADFVAKGYLPSDILAMNGDTASALRDGGKWLFDYYYLNEWGNPGQVRNKEFNWSFMESPSVEGVKPFIGAAFRSDSEIYYMQANGKTEHPELVCAVLDFFGGEELALKRWWGWEDDNYIVVDGQKQYTEKMYTMTRDELLDTYGTVFDTGANFLYERLITTEYALDAITASWYPETKERMAYYAKKLTDGEYSTQTYQPKLPTLEDEDYVDYSVAKAAVDTYVWENIMAFVNGTKPMSGWDSFVDGLSAYANVNAWADKFNSLPAPMIPANQTQRNYVGAAE